MLGEPGEGCEDRVFQFTKGSTRATRIAERGSHNRLGKQSFGPRISQGTGLVHSMWGCICATHCNAAPLGSARTGVS